MRIRETFNFKGHLEVYKVYLDGREELHWSDSNVITSGMSLALGMLYSENTAFASATPNNILNYQIRYFQLGVSGNSSYNSQINQLVSAVPISLLSGASLVLSEHDHFVHNSLTLTNQPFLVISQSNVYRPSPTSVRYHLIIPADSGNSIGGNINEVGLFMANPLNQITPQSILVAYKYFSEIRKTEEFALLFKWTINF